MADCCSCYRISLRPNFGFQHSKVTYHIAFPRLRCARIFRSNPHPGQEEVDVGLDLIQYVEEGSELQMRILEIVRGDEELWQD